MRTPQYMLWLTVLDEQLEGWSNEAKLNHFLELKLCCDDIIKSIYDAPRLLNGEFKIWLYSDGIHIEPPSPGDNIVIAGLQKIYAEYYHEIRSRVERRLAQDGCLFFDKVNLLKLDKEESDTDPKHLEVFDRYKVMEEIFEFKENLMTACADISKFKTKGEYKFSKLLSTVTMIEYEKTDEKRECHFCDNHNNQIFSLTEYKHEGYYSITIKGPGKLQNILECINEIYNKFILNKNNYIKIDKDFKESIILVTQRKESEENLIIIEGEIKESNKISYELIESIRKTYEKDNNNNLAILSIRINTDYFDFYYNIAQHETSVMTHLLIPEELAKFIVTAYIGFVDVTSINNNLNKYFNVEV